MHDTRHIKLQESAVMTNSSLTNPTLTNPILTNPSIKTSYGVNESKNRNMMMLV